MLAVARVAKTGAVAMAREVVLLLILVAAILLGLPFGAGYLAGRSKRKTVSA